MHRAPAAHGARGVRVRLARAIAGGSRHGSGREVEFRGLQMLSQRCRYELWHRTRRPRVGFGLDVCHAPSLAVPAVRRAARRDDQRRRVPPPSRRRSPVTGSGSTSAASRSRATKPPRSSRRPRSRATSSCAKGFDRDPGAPRAARRSVIPAARPTTLTRQRVDGARGRRVPTSSSTGTIEPRKAHRRRSSSGGPRARAARGMDVSLVIVGPIGWMPAADVAALDQPGRPAGWVAFPDATLDALYRHAAVVATASVYEGFGLPVLEAHRPRPAGRRLRHPGPRRGPRRRGPARPDRRRRRDGRSHRGAAGAIPTLATVLSAAAFERWEQFPQQATIDGHLAVYRSVARGELIATARACPPCCAVSRPSSCWRSGSSSLSAGAAFAHTGFEPEAVAPGSIAEIALSVAAENDAAGTTKIQLSSRKVSRSPWWRSRPSRAGPRPSTVARSANPRPGSRGPGPRHPSARRRSCG